MTHTSLIHGFKGIAALALVVGITISAQTLPLYASLTSTELHPVEGMIITPSYVQADTAAQLLLGMLLIVLGFFIYGLARTKEEGRPVHISVRPKKKQPAWYWLEVRL